MHAPRALTRSLVPALLLGSAAPALAQGLPVAYVSDTSGDTVWLLRDLDVDGTYDGVGEVTEYYSDALGPFALTNNAGMKAGPDGALYVTDTSEDLVLRLVDLDGDGDAHDPNEARVFFDGTAGNPSGVELTSGRGLHVDADGTVWVASANTGGGGNDAIVRLRDENGDGDANDAGEQLEYYLPAFGTGNTGDSIPASVVRGPDGALYYVETGSTGFLAKGLYRLEDLDGSGTIDQPGEATAFFLPTSIGGSSFFWDVCLDAEGYFLMDDTGDDVLRRFRDDSGDGVIDEGTESVVFWDAAGSSSLIWNVFPNPDGSYHVLEDSSPDRVLVMKDTDGDGVIDPLTEVTTAYDDTVAAVDLGSPKAVVTGLQVPVVGTSYCGPANPNSSGAPAEIEARGFLSPLAQEFSLRCTSMAPNQFGYFLVSDTQGSLMPAGSQGVLCLAGGIGRFSNQLQNSGPGGEISIPVQLLALPQPSGTAVVLPGSTWNFQCWFRDVNPTNTSNLSDAVSVTFL